MLVSVPYGCCADHVGRTVNPAPLTLDQKFQIYFQQTYSVSSLIIPAAVAGIDQATNSPKEWGGGNATYGKRLGTARGQFQFCNFSAFGIGAMLHEDPRFLPSAQHGTWARTKYVLVHTLVARTDSGGQEPAFGVFAGVLGFGFFPNPWLPPSQNSVGQAFERSATFLGAKVGMNMGIEFGPDDRRFFREKVLRKLFRH